MKGFKINDLLTPPNLTSLSRIPIAILMLFFYEHKVVFFLLLALAIFTDWLDGFLARKQGKTWLGAILDPLCDKIFVTILVLSMLLNSIISLWQLVLILLRDIFVVMLLAALWFHHKKIDFRKHLAARWPGKIVTVLQFVILVWAFLGVGYLDIPIALITIAALVAMVDYSLLADSLLKKK